jgi:hypothetical protein
MELPLDVLKWVGFGSNSAIQLDRDKVGSLADS